MILSVIILGLMGLFVIIIISSIIKIFIDDYKYISKSHSISEYKKISSRFLKDSNRGRFDKTSLPLDGGRTTFKESKSRSLMRYDYIRVDSIE